MRARLIAAFITVALLAALASAWVTNLILPFYPSLGSLIRPALISHLLGSHVPGTGIGRRPLEGAGFPARVTALAFVLAASGLLLATISGLAFAATRRVLRPVRRLGEAARQMAGGDLSARVEPADRDELAQLVTAFNTMASALQGKVGELEEMEARARRFAGDVSHELRTPLTAMTAVADILGDEAAADATAAARLVGQEIRHLNRLVEDLIEISRFDAGSAQLIAEETGVAAAVQQCLRARGWSGVCCTVPAGLTVRLDRRRFDVIVANLAGNALRHGAPPVTIQASIQGGCAGGSELVLQVRDHGPGIPAGVIARVFDRFYKADSARTRSEGSGLGLAIAQENARLHGGRIDAASDPGGGAVFTVRLPVH